MNQSTSERTHLEPIDHSNGDILPITAKPEVKSPNLIGSSATAIIVATLPIVCIVLIVLAYKILTKYFARPPRNIHLKRGSAATTFSTLSITTYETHSAPRPGSPTSSDDDVDIHIHSL